MVFDILLEKSAKRNAMSPIEQGLAQFYLEKIIKRIHDDGFAGLTEKEQTFLRSIAENDQLRDLSNSIILSAFKSVASALAKRHPDGTSPHKQPSEEWKSFGTDKNPEKLLKRFSVMKTPSTKTKTEPTLDELTTEYIFSKLIKNDFKALTQHELIFIEQLFKNSAQNPLIPELAPTINDAFDLRKFNKNNSPSNSTFSLNIREPYFFDALFHPVLTTGRTLAQASDHQLFFSALVEVARVVIKEKTKNNKVDFDELEPIYHSATQKIPTALQETYRGVYKALFSEEQKNNAAAHNIIEQLATYTPSQEGFEAAKKRHFEIEEKIRFTLAKMRLIEINLTSSLFKILMEKQEGADEYDIEKKILSSLQSSASFLEIFMYVNENNFESRLKLPQRSHKPVDAVMQNADEILEQFKQFSEEAIYKVNQLKDKANTIIATFKRVAAEIKENNLAQIKAATLQAITLLLTPFADDPKKDKLLGLYNPEKIIQEAFINSVKITFDELKERLQINSKSFYKDEYTVNVNDEELKEKIIKNLNSQIALSLKELTNLSENKKAALSELKKIADAKDSAKRAVNEIIEIQPMIDDAQAANGVEDPHPKTEPHNEGEPADHDDDSLPTTPRKLIDERSPEAADLGNKEEREDTESKKGEIEDDKEEATSITTSWSETSDRTVEDWKKVILNTLWGIPSDATEETRNKKLATAPDTQSVCGQIHTQWGDKAPSFTALSLIQVEENGSFNAKLNCSESSSPKSVTLTRAVDLSAHTQTWTCHTDNAAIDEKMQFQLIAAESLALRLETMGKDDPEARRIGIARLEGETDFARKVDFSAFGFTANLKIQLSQNEIDLIKAHIDMGFTEVNYASTVFSKNSRAETKKVMGGLNLRGDKTPEHERNKLSLQKGVVLPSS